MCINIQCVLDAAMILDDRFTHNQVQRWRDAGDKPPELHITRYRQTRRQTEIDIDRHRDRCIDGQAKKRVYRETVIDRCIDRQT